MKYIKFSWIVAFIAMAGSLFFSEVKLYIPCNLCWYQRILMYPLVIILGVALIKNDKKIYKYILPISIPGICISLFHYLKQKVPFFSKIEVCSTGIPCNGEYINWLGFITIPFLALTAFTLITILMCLLRKSEKNDSI